MGRREYVGAAQKAYLTTALGGTTGDLTIVCDDLTNWPTGASGNPFYIVIDRGLATEEKILCSSRAGNTLTVYTSGLTTGRGSDGTLITAHSNNAAVEHVFTATDADEANAHVNDLSIHGSGARGGGNDHIFWENDQIVTSNYTITSGKQAGTFGPVTIASGVTVTVPSGSVWSIV